MTESTKSPKQSLRVNRYALILAAGWTLAVGASLFSDYSGEQNRARTAASVAARAQFGKDVLYRRWNAGHGGVYVPISESTPPNPYLTQVEEREIETPSGRRLTLVNPAYMTRQVHELGSKADGVRGHITSLNPIRPANAADAWEKHALESFARGEREFASVETLDGEAHLRLMRPLTTEKGCLKCHAQQGYKEGDVRGGISVSMPMAPYAAIARKHMTTAVFAHGALWLLGLAGIGLSRRRIGRHIAERDRTEEELARHMAFERLISEISSAFVGLAPGDTDAGIEHALATIGAFSGTDRAYVFLFRNDGARIDNTHEWCTEGVEPQIENLKDIPLDEELPWFAERVRKCEVFHVPDVAALPPEARLEREHYDAQQIRSLIVVPMRLGDRLLGFLGFDMVRARRTWTDDEQALLQLVGENFVHAIERKRAEDALRKERDRAQRYLDIAGVMFVAIDGDGIVTLVNRRGCEILGYPAEEIVGKNWFDHFLTPEVRESVLLVSQALLGGDAAAVAYRENAVLTKSGEERLIAWHNVPLRDEHGNVTGHLSSGQDITEQRSMETQLRESQKLEAIGTLAGGVAHEINNPINGIMGYAQLIKDRLAGTNETLEEFAGEIIHETERIATLVKNLLQFSRHEQQSHSPARIHDIVEATLSLTRAVLRHDRITLDVDVPEDLPKIKCRSQQIQQVLMNLVTNARDALNDKYPGYDENKVIRISARELPKAERGRPNAEGREEEASPQLPSSELRVPSLVSRWVRLTVEDHGPGIPPEVHERIFTPFYTTKRPDKGTGLGLPMAHTIVKEHGGNLSMESEPGEWTRFVFDLPVSSDQSETESIE